MSGRRSRVTSCTAPGSPRTGRKTTPSAGSLSATAATTSTSSPCSPARTARSPVCRTSDTASGMRAGLPRNYMGCGEPPRGTGPEPGAQPAQRPRRLSATAGRSRPGSRSSGRSAPPLLAHLASRSSSSVSRTRRAGPQAVQHAQSRRGHRVRRRPPRRHHPHGHAGVVQRREAGRRPDLPRLQHRWKSAPTASGQRLIPAEQNAIWEHAARAANDAAGQIAT